PPLPQQGQGLAAATAEIEHGGAGGQIVEERPVGRDALVDLLLGAAVAALQLQVAMLLVRAGDDLGRRSLRSGLHGCQRAAEAAEQIPGLPPVTVQLLVGAGEEGVVVPHDLVQARGVEGLLILDAALVLGAGDLQPLQVLQQDEVEDALALPEVVLGKPDEGTEQAFEADDEPAEQAAVAADGERLIPGPQPSPVG